MEFLTILICFALSCHLFGMTLADHKCKAVSNVDKMADKEMFLAMTGALKSNAEQMTDALKDLAISSIDEWLQSIGLQVYASKIKDYGCDSLRALDDASEQDMKDMTQDPEIGMKKLHRIFFMKAWNQRAASKDFSDPM